MDDQHFSMLAERHRRVLRLYRERFRLKEIGLELGLSENSVNTYLTEAVQLLGAPGRRAAADALARYEDPSQSSRYHVSVAAAELSADLSGLAQQDGPAVSVGLFPLRPRAGTPNKLALHIRLFWIVALLISLVGGVAVAIAIYSVYVKPMARVLQ